jgi:dipeptidyl aminopeptidase/acylaminoacyl peptidase
MWGIIDVQQTIACANFLVDAELADKNKLILTGGSSGGFSVLNVLTKVHLIADTEVSLRLDDLRISSQVFS